MIKKVKVFSPQELNHFSYIHTLFHEIDSLDVIEVFSTHKKRGVLRVGKDLQRLENRFHKKTVISEFQLTGFTRNALVGFDLYDLASDYSIWALENCDFLFKRNLRSQDLEAVTSLFPNCKVLNFTWNFGCSGKSKFKYQTILGFIYFESFNKLKIDRYFLFNVFKGISYSLQHLKMVSKRRNIEIFRSLAKPQDIVTNRILFQTRCFSLEDENSQKIQFFRSEIISLLKREYSNHFVGGFIKDSVSSKLYPELLSPYSSDPSEYFNLLQSSEIVVYTDGLNNSPAWKLAEYASQGKIIIAQRFNFDMPFELRHLKDIIYFDNPIDLREILSNILNNSKLKKELSRNIRKVYMDYMDPLSCGNRIIDIVSNDFKERC